MISIKEFLKVFEDDTQKDEHIEDPRARDAVEELAHFREEQFDGLFLRLFSYIRTLRDEVIEEYLALDRVDKKIIGHVYDSWRRGSILPRLPAIRMWGG